jgi:hypothetical protein
MVCVTCGFFLTMKGSLIVPLRRDKYFDIRLNRYALRKLAEKNVRSLAITPDSLSLCYSEDVEPSPVKTVYGVARNEKDITFGDKEGVIRVDMAKVVKVRQNDEGDSQLVQENRRQDTKRAGSQVLEEGESQV